MTRRDASARAVDALRASPPALDELRRARMERRLVEAVARGERPREPQDAGDAVLDLRASRSGRARWAAAGALVAAAAVGLVALSWPRDEGLVARFEMGGTRTASGTLDVGGSLEVGAGERAEVRVGEVELQLAGGSAMRFGSLDARDVQVELTRGSVEVAFHPRERGRERLSIETPSARVEVVGTVFTVRLERGATRVAVREGTVRVVPRAAAESAVLVHAGQSVEIEADRPGRAEAPGAERAGERADVERGGDEDATVELTAAELTAAEVAATEVAATEGAATDVAATEVAARRAPRAASAPQDIVLPARPPAQGPVEIVALEEVPETLVQRPEVVPVPPRQRYAAARRVYEDGDHPRARAMFAELVRARDVPLDLRVEAQTDIGESFLLTGDPAAAVAAFERAAVLGRGRPEGHNAVYALARAQETALRDRDAARATYLRYLREAPHGALANLARQAVCRLGGDPAVTCPTTTSEGAGTR